MSRSLLPRDRARGHGLELCQGRFGLDLREKFFPEWAARGRGGDPIPGGIHVDVEPGDMVSAGLGSGGTPWSWRSFPREPVLSSLPSQHPCGPRTPAGLATTGCLRRPAGKLSLGILCFPHNHRQTNRKLCKFLVQSGVCPQTVTTD